MYINVILHLCPLKTLHVFCYCYYKTLQRSQKDLNGRFVQNTGASSPIINTCVFWWHLILLCCQVFVSLLRCHPAKPTLTDINAVNITHTLCHVSYVTLQYCYLIVVINTVNRLRALLSLATWVRYRHVFYCQFRT